MFRSEFILGGQKSGKSRRAEQLAAAWLVAGAGHGAVFIATAQPWDAEMRERIARHQRDRADRVPGMLTVEEPLPLRLAETIGQHSQPDTLVVVDCLTLWLTHLLMPMDSVSGSTLSFDGTYVSDAVTMLLDAVRNAQGPIVLVGNEIGLGVIPMGREVRAFVDALGQLNQGMASVCDRVTLMAAGLPLTLKAPA
jgi:adenosylcobinamide kinase/adenosylcobinamide-phosphate guanylyltransferase